VPSVVPPALARIAALLRCPTCSQPLAPATGALCCAHGHTHNVARHGYVTLVPPGRRPADGDDAAMVAARAAVLDADHFMPLTRALVSGAVATATRGASVVLDAGAGVGHHLAAVLDALPDARGIALDASRPALRRATRGHARMAGVVGDVWRHLPLADAAVDLVLNVFAPRNPAEFARVLHPGGALLVVTPRPEHLQELAALHRVGIDPDKLARLHRQLAPWFAVTRARRVAWELRLSRDDVAAIVRMGPAARHMTPTLERRLRALPEPLAVTAAVDIHMFRRVAGRSRAPQPMHRDASVAFSALRGSRI
jgi:23S rRNA (guanine745-N1)-methyltransferase